MAFRNIVREGDPVLRKVSRPVEQFDERLWTLLDDMAETLYRAEGAGLAAPQVGILRRESGLYCEQQEDFYAPCLDGYARFCRTAPRRSGPGRA